MQFASVGDYNSSSQVSNKPLSNLAKLYEAGHFYNLPSLFEKVGSSDIKTF